MKNDLHQIPGFEGYYAITKEGGVWSCPRQIRRRGGSMAKVGHWMKTPLAGGYKTVLLVRDGRQSRFAVHRLLALVFIGLKEGEFVDHRDRNRLNNDLSNLRICSASQNVQNRAAYGKQGATGVSVRASGRWQARIYHQGKKIYLGSFPSKLDAIEAYNKAAREFFGEFACLNETKYETICSI